MTASLTPLDALHHCVDRHWAVVGYELKLLVRMGETVTVAVLARDDKGHFVAVSPLDQNGQMGFGIIDLNTAEARFEALAGLDGRRPN